MKRRLKLLFLLSFVLLAVGFQAQSGSEDKAELVNSFGAIPNGDFRGRADMLMTTITSREGSRALIVLYGTPAQVEARKRLFQNHFVQRGFPVDRISYKVGGHVSEWRTDLYIIPKGAAPPDIKPEAWIYYEVGRAYKRDIVERFKLFVEEIIERRDHQGSIINYGTAAEIALRERWISDSIRYRGIDPLRLTIVNGGPGPVRTVMWLVPPGAENPKP